jgi:hypothetical protein
MCVYSSPVGASQQDYRVSDVCMALDVAINDESIQRYRSFVALQSV